MSARAPNWRTIPASAFASVAARWDALNDAGFRSPVLHSDFVGPLSTHFGDGSERIAYMDDGRGDWIAAGLFARSGVLVSDAFQPSQAPLGPWLQRDGARGLPDATTMAALASALGTTTAIVGLSQLDPEHVARDAHDREDRVESDYIRTARITIAGSFDDYWAKRGKNLRANMKKQRSRLESECVGLRFDRVSEPAGVAAAVADYGRLESAGWKASGGTAVAADNAQGRFYREILERFAARGMTRIQRCFLGDRLAAMDLCIEHDGTLVILKTAFDETIRGVSPAFLMRQDYLPAIFDEGRVRRIEFYGRVMDWHTKWSDEVRTLFHATTYRWPLVGRLDRFRRARAARRDEPVAETAAA